jgi:uncharacterized protein DUF1573
MPDFNKLKTYRSNLIMGLLLFFMSDLNAQTDSNKVYFITNKYPEISFENEVYDFGNIRKGDTVHYNFKFTNTGNAALLIKDASSGCDCTVPKWSHDPIKPGESSAISITFISDEEGGSQTKEITVTSNAKTPVKILHFVGYVDYSEK